MNIIIGTGVAAFIFGMLSMRYDKAFKLFLVSSVPIAWLFAKLAPSFLSVSKAGTDGFVTFYIQWFESMTPEQQEAVYLFPAFFILGRILFWLYKIYIYKEKVETPQARKRRILADYPGH